MIFLVFALALAVVGYWIHLDAKYHLQRRRWTRRDANLAIHEERKSDLTDEQFSTGEDEKEEASDIDLILLDDVDDEASSEPNSPTSSWFPYVTGGTLAVLALVGYMIWGDPFAIRMEKIPEQIQNASTEEDLDEIMDLLHRRNSSRHGDIASANYLINGYFIRGDFEKVVREHKFAEQRGTNSIASDLDRVRAAFELDGYRISDESKIVVDRILADVPDHPLILQLQALQSYALSDFTSARAYIERLLRQPVGQPVVAVFDPMLDRVNNNLDPDHVGVRVNLQIENLRTPNQWLTVFAHIDDGSAPIAVVRRANATPGNYTLLLDDIVSMVPGRNLSSFDRVAIVARLSPSSNVADVTHASQIQSGWISPSPNATVSLRLTESVASDSIAVTVALDQGLTAEQDWPVFIVGRRIDTPGPPLLVKRVLVSDLPISLSLSSNDTMLPDSEFPDGDIEVFARVSSSGSASRSENDIESEKVRARLGQNIGLKLDKLVKIAEEP